MSESFRNKRPLTRNSPNRATDDIEQIHSWTKRYPTANFASVTGKRSQILVLDIDVQNCAPGKESLARLLEKELEKLGEDNG